MADSAANLAMDTRTSTQVHFPTQRAAFNNLTQDLDNDVMHWLMRTQDDYLTFQLRDIKRLVPAYENYLALYQDYKQERLQALAEILTQRVQVGNKNGHLVVTEIPLLVSSNACANERREVNIYRSTRYVPLQISDNNDTQEEAVLAEVTVNEVYAASTSDLWWLEIHALIVEGTDGFPGSEADCPEDDNDKQDLDYRPSESMSAGVRGFESAESELFSIHEELLEPVLVKLSFVQRRGGNMTPRERNGDAGRLTLDSEPEEAAAIYLLIDLPSELNGVLAAAPCGGTTNVFRESNEKYDGSANGECASVAAAENIVSELESSLDHRCIVNISDTFYCVHTQEIWDAELMLEIRTEDPESLTQFHLVVHEPELMAIATYLFETGVVEENYASQVTYELPRYLHTPICKLLKKHLKPLALADEGAGDTKLPEAQEKEKLDHELELCRQSITQGQPALRCARYGCRHQERREYVMLQVWSGFESFEGLVLGTLVISRDGNDSDSGNEPSPSPVISSNCKVAGDATPSSTPSTPPSSVSASAAMKATPVDTPAPTTTAPDVSPAPVTPEVTPSPMITAPAVVVPAPTTTDPAPTTQAPAPETPALTVSDTFASPLAAITYTLVGGSGMYGKVTSVSCPGTGQGTCVQEDHAVSGPLAPFDEDLTLALRGPLQVDNIAVFTAGGSSNASSSSWTKVPSYSRANNNAMQNMVVLNNKGDETKSSEFSMCHGNSQSYATSDGTTAATSASVFNGVLADGIEVNMMSESTCDTASGTYGFARGVAYEGWRGASKIFMVQAQMPHAEGKDVSAIWLLNGQVVRTAEYGCNCRGMGDSGKWKGGCGELDVAEVLPEDKNALTSTMYSFKGSRGTAPISMRPTDASVVFVVVFSGETSQVQILLMRPEDVDVETPPTPERVQKWLDYRNGEQVNFGIL
ncbi:putative gpi anchor protein, partial [Globisporangium splendens]